MGHKKRYNTRSRKREREKYNSDSEESNDEVLENESYPNVPIKLNFNLPLIDSPQDNDYFTPDNSPFVTSLIFKIKNVYPRISKKKLNSIITECVEDTNNKFINEYNGQKPLDQAWKSTVPEDDVKMLEPKLKKLRISIDEDVPTLPKILSANTTEKNKKKALELFDILNNTPNYTVDYIQIRDDINSLIHGKFVKDDQVLLQQVEEEEKRLIGNESHIQGSDELKMKVYSLQSNDSVKAKLYEMCNRLSSLPKDQTEYSNLRDKIKWAISLPYNKMKFPTNDISNNTPQEIGAYCDKIYKNLDSKLYGMKNVKQRIIQILNNRISNPTTKSMIGLKGPAGVGKTAIAKALSESLEMPFERISLGGMEDPSVFKGTDNSWVGASPSILLHILRRMKYSNGIVLFDEIDKISKSEKGKAIQYTLLHITDYIQNSEFHDQYLSEFPHDLSNIWFMFAMNDENWLDPLLKDRIDIINVSAYSKDDMCEIIQRHILPLTIKNIGLEENSIKITTSACQHLINLLGVSIKGEGLRIIEKEIYLMVSKINLLKISTYTPSIELDFNVSDFEGLPYTITTKNIQSLYSRKIVNTNPSYLNMYS